MRKRLAWSAMLVGLTVVACHTITEELPQEPTPVRADNRSRGSECSGDRHPGSDGDAAAGRTGAEQPGPEQPRRPRPRPTGAGGQSCPLPAGKWNENCSMQTQTFLNRVEAAIDEVVAHQPAVLQPEPDARRLRQLLPGGGSHRLRQPRRPGGHRERGVRLLRRRRAGGEEQQLVQRPVRHPDLGPVHPPPGRIVPLDLPSGLVLVLTTGSGPGAPRRASFASSARRRSPRRAVATAGAPTRLRTLP